MYKRILVPVDGSNPSNSGLLEAIRFAKEQSAGIRLLHVVGEHALDPDYCVGTYAGDVVESLRAAGQKVLHEGVALVQQFGLEPEAMSVESLTSNAATLIAAHAKEWGADLIVMGTHGRHGLERFLMGSTAEAVVRDTRIPVLLVHDGSANTPHAQQAASTDLQPLDYRTLQQVQ